MARLAGSALGLGLAMLQFWAPVALRAQEPQAPPDITEIDLDDLMNVNVTSPGRKTQALTTVASAVYVIRGEDVRRSGATSIAEALRGVPGFFVGRADANSWAICPRGFGDVLSNKLLVLIDGRSVYSPLHSGVHWDVQDTFLEDLDRIEVIRGPGGSLWGANAINGIVNVITKPSTQVEGGLVTAGGGTEARVFGGARYGAKASEDLHVRAYAKYFQWDDARDGTDPDRRAYDGWSMARGGVRADWKAGPQDRISFLADYYDGLVKERATNPILTAPFAQTLDDRMDVRGADAVLRWERTVDPTSSLSLQLYYDFTRRSAALFKDSLQTGDVDFQHRFSPFDGNEVTWGAGYRIYRSVAEDSFPFQVNPDGHTDDIVSAFLQDEITLVQDHLQLTLGSKVEHNDYSGFEYQPSGRIAWTPHERHHLWGSVSRAVRTPSILDADGRLTPVTGPGPTAFSIFGNDEFRSEHMLAYEAGYRIRPVDAISLDLALFYNRYDRLRTGTVGAFFVEASPPPAHLVVPILLENDMHGRTRGVEVSGNFQLAPWWLIQATYSHLHMNMNQGDLHHRSPHQQAWLRSAMDLPGNLTADVTARYVGGMPAFDVKAYAEVDVRLAWRDPSNGIEAALVGQNLCHTTHAEFNSAVQRSEIQRGVYASLTIQF